MGKDREIILGSLEKLQKWIEDHDYKGYDPFDGLSSFFRPLTFGNLLLDRILMQLIRQSPVNLRPLFGVKPLNSNIAMGYMVWGYITMFKTTGDQQYKKKAVDCLEWLEKNKAPGFEKFSWGKHFNYASRGGRYSKLEPITVWTSLIGLAFLDAYETFGDEKYIKISKSVCDWILDLPRTKTDSGICLNYTAYDEEDCTIHNQSMLASAMLAKTARLTKNKKYSNIAKEAMRYSCTSQLANGAWYYGEDPKFHWIDNFHTGYNLDGLKCYIENMDDTQYNDNLNRGFDFYKTHFFENNGRPKYYHNRAYPIDSQCASQAIETLSKFSDHDPSALTIAIKVANWTINNMQDKTGYFYYRQYPFIKAKMPMIHWSQATIYKSLSLLVMKMDG